MRHFHFSKHLHTGILLFCLSLLVANVFALRFVLAQTPFSSDQKTSLKQQPFSFLSIDNQLISSQSQTLIQNQTPLFKGMGNALTPLYFHIYSNEFSYTHTVTVQSNGLWSFTSPIPLPSASYSVDVYYAQDISTELQPLFSTRFDIQEKTTQAMTSPATFMQMNMLHDLDTTALYQGSQIAFGLSVSDQSIITVALENESHTRISSHQQIYDSNQSLLFSLPFSLPPGNYVLSTFQVQDTHLVASSHPLTVIETPLLTKLALQMRTPYLKGVSIIALSSCFLLLIYVLSMEGKKLFTLYQKQYFKKYAKIVKNAQKKSFT